MEIVEAVVRQDRSVFRCRLDGHVAGAILELPQWVFDQVVCCRIRATDAPAVRCGELRLLRQLLEHRLGDEAAAEVEDRQIPWNSQGDTDDIIGAALLMLKDAKEESHET